MARVLVTALGRGRLSQKGTSKYDKATYFFQDESEEEYDTEFIAEALVKYYDIQRIYIVGTVRSMWEQVYYNFTNAEDRDEDYYLKLGELIEKSNRNTYHYEQGYLRNVETALDRRLDNEGSRCYLIKYGLDRDELLYNFDILMQISDQLQPGDEVYVDITHSFRSLSIFQYMMTSFIENLPDKDVKIKKILYGMLDVQSEMNNKTPVVDLTVINELNHWIKGIYELESYGNGYMIATLLQNQNPELSENINNLTDRININYLKDLKDEKSTSNWQHLGKINGPGSIATTSIKRFVRIFAKEDRESFFQLQVARWYFQKKRYATGYITLAEAIITRACEILGLDSQVYQNREDAKSRIPGLNQDFERLKKKVFEVRNMVAHFEGGSENKYQSAIKKCDEYCDQAERLFEEIGAQFLVK